MHVSEYHLSSGEFVIADVVFFLIKLLFVSILDPFGWTASSLIYFHFARVFFIGPLVFGLFIGLGNDIVRELLPFSYILLVIHSCRAHPSEGVRETLSGVLLGY